MTDHQQKTLKEARIQKGTITPEDLALINGYTMRPFGEEELFVFRLVLCDNQPDRDGEAFTIQALGQLAELFRGRTVIADHRPLAENQQARIYRTQVEEDPEVTTPLGEPYTRLTASCYMVRTLDNAGEIALIEGGVRKEVSVGCAVGRKVCSVCGADWPGWGDPPCGHKPGERTGGVLCCRRLDDARDAYEVSFVAVPAQPAAGVTKGYGPPGRDQEIEQVLNSARGLLKRMEEWK